MVSKYIASMLILFPGICFALDLSISNILQEESVTQEDFEIESRKKVFLSTYYRPSVIYKLKQCHGVSRQDRLDIQKDVSIEVEFIIMSDGSVADLKSESTEYPRLASTYKQTVSDCAPFSPLPDFEGVQTDRYKIKVDFVLSPHKNTVRIPFNIRYSN